MFFKLTADQLLVHRLDRGLKSLYFSGVLAKGKWRVVDFCSDI